MTDQTGRAEAIASIAHRGQVDKLGQPYIEHPRRVAAAFEPGTIEHCAAWLHDVIEDTDVTANDLRAAGVTPQIVDVVELLTRRPDVPSELYYERIRLSPSAKAVKLADIADNTAPWRVAGLDVATQERLAEKYRKARTALNP